MRYHEPRMRGQWLCLLGGVIFLGLCACQEAPPAIESTTVLQSTPDTVGPYVVQSVIVGVTGHDVELRYQVDDDLRFIPLPMLPDDGGELFRAAIPGRSAGSTISYYVTVLEGRERVADDPEAAAAGPYVFTILAP
jgi:hypothetical protein